MSELREELDLVGEQRDELARRVDELETALRELYGSYVSLLANLEGTAFSAPRWDGPICARRALGLPEAEAA